MKTKIARKSDRGPASLSKRSSRGASQLSFLQKQPRFFGGQLLHGRRRTHRPLSSKESIHLVMRSSWAMGPNSFLNRRNKEAIHQILNQRSAKYGVKIYLRALAGNHIHLIVKISNRTLYKRFVRATSGLIASHVMRYQSFKVFKASLKAGDGSPRAKKEPEIQGLDQQFWQFRPFSRIIGWGRDFTGSCNYLRKNILEAFGFIKYTERKHSYAKWIKQTIELQT